MGRMKECQDCQRLLRVGDRVKALRPDKGSTVLNWCAGTVDPGTEGTVYRVAYHLNMAYIDWDRQYDNPDARTFEYAIHADPDDWHGQFERLQS